MKKILKLLFLLPIFSLFFVLPLDTKADESSINTGWNILNFKSEITVNKDSSLLITEKITADCGNSPDKHGIYRIIPTQTTKSDFETINTPIELVSITDFNNSSINYETIKNARDHTITWKIGDPNKTVTGINNYKIIYKVKNAIRSDNSKFDELYWNLNGNFWQINIEHFSTEITLPSEISKEKTKISLYSGKYFSSSNDFAKYRWLNDGKTIFVNSTKTLAPSIGVTISVAVPKNIISSYKPSFLERYGSFLWLLIPVIAFITCLLVWLKFGKDPKVNSAIAPEFEIPENLSPLEMGMIMSNGELKTGYVTAQIIQLAVKGAIKIEQVQEKTIFKKADYALSLQRIDNLDFADQQIINSVFSLKEINETVRMSSLEHNFITEFKDIEKETKNNLVLNGYLLTEGSNIKKIMFPISFALLMFSGYGFLIATSFYSPMLFISLAATAIIMIVFSILMPKRSNNGSVMEHRIKGLKLYMDTAEKYTQKFNAEENIFEKLLPYAIMFGIVDKWVLSMQTICGDDCFNNYHPVWFYGSNLSNFDISEFTSNINNLSEQIANTISSSGSSSGFGGGGFSGGGGGGGGGGGW